MAGSNFVGDIIGNRFPVPMAVTHASVASNGASSRLGQIGPFSFDLRLRNAWWSPTGADHAATQSASYRKLTVVNAGTSGTGTAVMGSVALSASKASLGATAFDSCDSTVTLASGQIMVFNQTTVGAADANGTVLVAGQIAIGYEVI